MVLSTRVMEPQKSPGENRNDVIFVSESGDFRKASVKMVRELLVPDPRLSKYNNLETCSGWQELLQGHRVKNGQCSSQTMTYSNNLVYLMISEYLFYGQIDPIGGFAMAGSEALVYLHRWIDL